jgi:hypothetical protein
MAPEKMQNNCMDFLPKSAKELKKRLQIPSRLALISHQFSTAAADPGNCVALCRAPRHTVEYACGALRNLYVYTWREAPSAIPFCAASLRKLVRNAG